MTSQEARAALGLHVEHANALAEWFQARSINSYDSIRVYALALAASLSEADIPIQEVCKAVCTELVIAHVSLRVLGADVSLEEVGEAPPDVEERTLQ